MSWGVRIVGCLVHVFGEFMSWVKISAIFSVDNFFPASNPDSIAYFFLLPCLWPKKAQQDCLCKINSNMNKVQSLRAAQGNLSFKPINKAISSLLFCQEGEAQPLLCPQGHRAYSMSKQSVPLLDSSDLEMSSSCWASVSQPGLLVHSVWLSCMRSSAPSST